MLTPTEKSPLPENFPRGGSNSRRCGITTDGKILISIQTLNSIAQNKTTTAMLKQCKYVTQHPCVRALDACQASPCLDMKSFLHHAPHFDTSYARPARKHVPRASPLTFFIVAELSTGVEEEVADVVVDQLLDLLLLVQVYACTCPRHESDGGEGGRLCVVCLTSQ